MGLLTVDAESSTIQLHLACTEVIQRILSKACFHGVAYEAEIKRDGVTLYLAGVCPPPPLCWHNIRDYAIKQVSKLIWLKTCPRKAADCFSAVSVG